MWIVGIIWAILTALALIFFAGCHVNEENEKEELDDYFKIN